MTVHHHTVERTDDALLDLIQRAHFNYFLVNRHRLTGLIKDRNTAYSPASVAGCGFALTAYCVGVSRRWLSRDQGARLCLDILTSLLSAEQGVNLEGNSGTRGFFYHFLDPATATRASDLKFWPQLSRWFKTPPERIDVEVSAIDTALLVAGCLAARNFFDRATGLEKRVRKLSTRLYERVDWTWLLDSDNLLRMGWKPESGLLESRFQGLTEALLLYVIALGSPTHAISAEAWDSQLKGIQAVDLYGEHFVAVPDNPLFAYQYPLCWLDLRGIVDDTNVRLGFDWFENARRATLSHHRYALANPLDFRGYGPWAWGLSACDGPGDRKEKRSGREYVFHAYGVRGAGGPDDGTIAPTAAASSLPLTPGLVLPLLRHWVQRCPQILTETGFTDAFNATADLSTEIGWIGADQLSIDQGPIVIMIENFRSGLVWRLLRGDRAIQTGLARAGFSGGWLDEICKGT